MRTLTLALLVLLLVACTESSSVVGDASFPDGATQHDASSGKDASAKKDAATAQDAASAADAALPADCHLPIVSGNCDAYFERYAWNPQTSACEKFVYGGCGGNANNFETALACLAACAATRDAGTNQPAACKVGDSVYPSGADGIRDPHSCNMCSCVDGQLICTEINCPTACPPNSKASTGCAACGPVDNCEIVEYGCFPVCDTTADCASTAYGLCLDHACKNVCG